MRHIDSEERQMRAIEAMDALEYLLASVHEEEDIPIRYVGSLVGLVHGAVRDALPRGDMMMGANDRDD